MATTPYENARKLIETLGPADQLRLIAELTSRLSGTLDRRSRSLLEFEGLGQDLWQGIDVDEYLRQERSTLIG
jgi:hypothetical protein